MKKSLILFTTLPLFLVACSSPAPVNSQANSLAQAEVKSEVLPKPITSNSYVLAEPLAGKKVKISITAKDQDLYIRNCNAYIGINLIDKTNSQNNWGEVVTSCSSPNLIIPQGSTLTFERQITESHFPVNMNVTYQVSTGLSYNPNLKDHEISDEKRLSNPIKLLP